MFDIKENLKRLPDKPGVYMHKDRLGKIIYVGKAISLKNRVRQYFQSSYQTSPKIRALVSNIAEFEYITCNSEMEALILECNLIKKHMPKYNVLLRDDKTYPYICITVSEEFPRVVKTRKLEKDGNRYFGPYSDVGAVNEIISLLGDIYKLKRCKRTVFPKDHRPCLNYFIGACRGYCIGEGDREEYLGNIREIEEFLGGKERPLVKRLKNLMNESSDKLEYEDAARWRDAIRAVESLSETQRATMISDKDLDIVHCVRSGDQVYVVLFPVRDGKLSGRDTFPIQADKEDEDREIISQFLRQYYSQWAVVPPEILISEEVQDLELLEEFLSTQGRRVHITVPKRGDKRALLKMTQDDTRQMAADLSGRAETRREREEEISRQMHMLLQEAGYGTKDDLKPLRVESYDISNTNGVDSVGAMVVFSGSTRVRKDYRRFKVKTVEGPDDYGSLQEVLFRRLKRAREGDKGFVVLPDIIMMDGGLGQVNAARKVMEALHMDIPVVGMAKDDSHRTRAIVFPDGHEIELKDHPVLFRYAGTIQEEVHRFAIDYHHKLHGKKAMHSALDDIEGIGPKRRNELLYHFKSIEAIRKAGREELMEVPSITEKVADNIIDFFRK